MLLEKEQIPLVEMESMNAVHYEDVDLINHLFEALLAYEKNVNDTNAIEVESAFEAWILHTVAHFQKEEEQMRSTQFPPYPMHKGVHDANLLLLRQLFASWQKSREIQPLKIYLIEELPMWLTQHIQTMDTVTARYLKTAISTVHV